MKLISPTNQAARANALRWKQYSPAVGGGEVPRPFRKLHALIKAGVDCGIASMGDRTGFVRFLSQCRRKGRPIYATFLPANGDRHYRAIVGPTPDPEYCI